MLYEAVLLGSKKFHNSDWHRYYDQYASKKNWKLWESSTLSVTELEKLIRFLNQWHTRYQSSPDELLLALLAVFTPLNALAEKTLFDVDFEEQLPSGQSVFESIEQIFGAIANCGRRCESTGTSKILHTINPHLFVMWDERIAYGYAVDRRVESYARRFLPRMQKLLRRAITECMQSTGQSSEEALSALCQCGHTPAMVIDEYNWMKFTEMDDEVWNKEFE